MENIKVLIVDDNKRIVNLLKEALTKESDIEVVATASDGEEALNMIDMYNPDVMLLDLIMPKLDGIGVMEKLKNDKYISKPKTIVVSAVNRERITGNAAALRAFF